MELILTFIYSYSYYHGYIFDDDYCSDACNSGDKLVMREEEEEEEEADSVNVVVVVVFAIVSVCCCSMSVCVRLHVS